MVWLSKIFGMTYNLEWREYDIGPSHLQIIGFLYRNLLIFFLVYRNTCRFFFYTSCKNQTKIHLILLILCWLIKQFQIFTPCSYPRKNCVKKLQGYSLSHVSMFNSALSFEVVFIGWHVTVFYFFSFGGKRYKLCLFGSG